MSKRNNTMIMPLIVASTSNELLPASMPEWRLGTR